MNYGWKYNIKFIQKSEIKILMDYLDIVYCPWIRQCNQQLYFPIALLICEHLFRLCVLLFEIDRGRERDRECVCCPKSNYSFHSLPLSLSVSLIGYAICYKCLRLQADIWRHFSCCCWSCSSFLLFHECSAPLSADILFLSLFYLFYSSENCVL